MTKLEICFTPYCGKINAYRHPFSVLVPSFNVAPAFRISQAPDFILRWAGGRKFNNLAARAKIGWHSKFRDDESWGACGWTGWNSLTTSFDPLWNYRQVTTYRSKRSLKRCDKYYQSKLECRNCWSRWFWERGLGNTSKGSINYWNVFKYPRTPSAKWSRSYPSSDFIRPSSKNVCISTSYTPRSAPHQNDLTSPFKKRG